MNLDTRQIVAAIIGGLLLLAIGGLTGWAWTISERVSKGEERQISADARISSLESGRTTPMAAETRKAFEGVEKQLASMQREIQGLSEGQHEIIKRLLDGRARKDGAGMTPDQRGG